MWDKAKEIGSEFAFHMAIEISKPDIVKGFREWLSGFTIQEFKEMILKGEMPPVSGDMFSNAAPYVKYMEGFSVFDLFEFVGEASPELFKMIQDMGAQGANYLVTLRQYLLDCCKHPEKAPAVVPDAGKAPEMVSVTCDKCGKKFVVKKSEVATLEKCPFCEAPNK